MAAFIRKHLTSLLLATAIVVLLVVPGAKAFVLKGFLKTGLFNAAASADTASTAGVDVSNAVFLNAGQEQVSLGSLKGKVILINSWATWCAPCVAEMGGLNALYNKLKADDRFVFILADADNDFTAARTFMNNRHYDLPLYQAANADASALLGNTLPTTLIIDRQGRLRQKHEGIANYDTEEMRKFLLSL
ncbi:MAG TPA: TlpA disulfide reductase family protein [Chitinophagaceae bacterium]|nr:TlpA disulfide reductase family protein [Chitinophagaceae bacterium]